MTFNLQVRVRERASSGEPVFLYAIERRTWWWPFWTEVHAEREPEYARDLARQFKAGTWSPPPALPLHRTWYVED